MGWTERYRRHAALAEHLGLACATVALALTNLALWALAPFGPDHALAGLALLIALTLCYLKYRR